jgi:2-haloacid dehalogenase/putative hydrolase of the HAD superfamily
MPGRRFDAIMIDFYGTICAGDREAVEAACRGIVDTCGLALSPEDLAIRWGNRFFDLIERSNHQAFQTLHECEKQSLTTTLAEFGVSADPGPLVAKIEEYWRDPPIYPDALDFLNSVDLPLCCVSNADTEPLLTAIGNQGFRFDAVVTSESARCYKPDPGIFRQAAGSLGIEAHRAVHIGDSLHSDVSGAARAGIATVWLCRDSRIHDIGNCHPDYQISVLTEFNTVVDN